MKIVVQQVVTRPADVSPTKEFFALQQNVYKRIARPDTQLVMKVPSGGITNPVHNNYLGMRSLNDIILVRSMLEAAKDGADAITEACWFDSGIETTRRLTDVPVVGICEASMHLASTMGSKFAVISSEPEYIPSMEEQLHHYKMSANAITLKPIRTCQLGIADEMKSVLSGKYGPVCDDFAEIARGCVADGAEVIICGCGLLAPILSQAGVNEVSGVPVINPVSVGIKWAEMLADFRSAGMPVISRKGINMAPSLNEAEALIKALLK